MVDFMIPILYQTTETEFTSNGLGRLSDAVSCTVREVRNGEYELAMSYPITGIHYEDIQLTRLIFATPGENKPGQPFEIYDISRPLNGIVSIRARHISYRLNKIVTGPFTAASCFQAMNGLGDNAIGTCPFTFWTDKVVTANFKVETPSSIRSLLGGQQGSILDTYGTGEYEFDRFTVRLHLHRGTDSGVTLRYGKNITELVGESDVQSVYTGVVPYFFRDPNMVTLSAPVYGPHREDYPYDMVIPVDLTEKFAQDVIPTQEQLQAAAESYVNNSTGWQINTNIRVSFVNLADTEEYKDIAALQRVNLCDTVRVYHEALGVDTTAQVVSVTYNVLTERYDQIELGAVQASLGEAITDSIIKEVPTYSVMDKAIQNGTRLITGNMGGHLVLKPNANGEPEELLIMDSENIEDAVNIWRFNQSGLGFSHNGYDGPYSTAWTIDGSFYANNITSGTLDAGQVNVVNLDASNITTGTLTADHIDFTGKVVYEEDASDPALQITAQYEEQGVLVESTLTLDALGLKVAWDEGGSDNGSAEITSQSFICNLAGYRSILAPTSLVVASSGGSSAFQVNTGMARFNVTAYDESGNVIVSDERIKHDISDLEHEKALKFIKSLRPRVFKYDSGTSNRNHHGFIAQEVLEAMNGEDWGVFVTDPDGINGLRENEIISDLVKVVQEQQNVIERLTERVAALEEKDDN